MGLTGDRYVSTYEGHTIELIRNNWIKTLKLLIDGKVVSSSLQILPHDVTLTGALEHGGIRRRRREVGHPLPLDRGHDRDRRDAIDPHEDEIGFVWLRLTFAQCSV